MCEWKYDDGESCVREARTISRGLALCDVHYAVVNADNKYRAKHNIEIPHKDQTIQRRISKIILNSKVSA